MGFQSLTAEPNPKWHSYEGDSMKGSVRDYNRNSWFWQEDRVSGIGPLRKWLLSCNLTYLMPGQESTRWREVVWQTPQGRGNQRWNYYGLSLSHKRNISNKLWDVKIASTINELEWKQSTNATQCIGPSIRISIPTRKRPHTYVKHERKGVQNENELC